MIKVKTIVDETLGQHPEGAPFFEALDKALIKDDVLIQIEEMVVKKFGSSPYIIVSGEFGRFVMAVRSHTRGLRLVAPSGIRDGEPMDDLSYLHDQLQDKPFIFIDSSIYSYRTVSAINAELRRHGAHIEHIFVAYDGSTYPQNERLSSVYRYHPFEGYGSMLTSVNADLDIIMAENLVVTTENPAPGIIPDTLTEAERAALAE